MGSGVYEILVRIRGWSLWTWHRKIEVDGGLFVEGTESVPYVHTYVIQLGGQKTHTGRYPHLHTP